MNRTDYEKMLRQYTDAKDLVDKAWKIYQESLAAVEVAERNYNKALKLREDIHEAILSLGDK